MTAPQPVRRATYDEIRPDLQLGDLVLFSGRGWISWGIKLATRSPWSHVGMVVNHDNFDMVALWESTTLSKVKDLESHTFRRGVQVVPLSQRIATHDGSVAVRRLVVKRDRSMVESVKALREAWRGRDYESNKLQLFLSAYDGPFGENVEDLSSLFCSELVAEAYQRFGLLSDAVPSNEYTPADFSESSNLVLLRGKLTHEIAIVEAA